MRTLILLSCMLVLCLPSAQAATPEPPDPLDTALNKCFTEHPGTTSEKRCIYKMMPLWEARLKTAYQALGGDKNAKLKTSQRQWLAYQQAHRTYLTQGKYAMDGTLYRLLEAHELLEILRDRTLALEGDLAFLRLHS